MPQFRMPSLDEINECVHAVIEDYLREYDDLNDLDTQDLTDNIAMRINALLPKEI